MNHRVARCLATCCAALALLGAGGCSASVPPLADKSEPARAAQVSDAALATPGTLTVAVDAANAPLSMLGDDGQPTGYAADVARALARELGLSVTVVNAAPSAAADGEADVYLSMDSDAVPAGTAAAGTVLSEATAVFTRELDGNGTMPTLSASDLSSARIAVQDGSSSQQTLSNSNVTYSEVTCANVNQCISAVESGQADYAVCNASAGCYLDRSFGDIGLAGTVGEPTDLVAVVASGNAELSAAVSQALDALEGNGVLGAVRCAWFGRMPDDLASLQIADVFEVESAADDEAEAASADADADASAGAAASTAQGESGAASTGASTGADAADLPATSAHSSLNSTSTFFATE